MPNELEEYEEINIVDEAMDRFKPLDEEEQKDLLYICITSAVELYDKFEEAKKRKAKRPELEKIMAQAQTYQMIAEALTDKPEWMKSIGLRDCFILKYARVERTKYEAKRKERKA